VAFSARSFPSRWLAGEHQTIARPGGRAPGRRGRDSHDAGTGMHLRIDRAESLRLLTLRRRIGHSDLCVRLEGEHQHDDNTGHEHGWPHDEANADRLQRTERTDGEHGDGSEDANQRAATQSLPA
jgi:hypothetical protein